MTKGFSPRSPRTASSSSSALGKRLSSEIRITSGFVEFATISRTANRSATSGGRSRITPSVEITS
jgi:hypothetical protein